jgi:hypothetical protein
MTLHPAHCDQFPYIEVSPRIRQTFRRGFVDEVELPIGAFAGHCPACEDGWFINETPNAGDGEDGVVGGSRMRCEVCYGAGQREGYAGALFREHPAIRKVIFRSRNPVLPRALGRQVRLPEWRARSSDLGLDFIDTVPFGLFKLLENGEYSEAFRGPGLKEPVISVSRTYQSTEDAVADLSDAAITYGRNEALKMAVTV